MIKIKDVAIKPLITSKKGHHLSAYISNPNDISALRKQLSNVIESTKTYLKPVLSDGEINKFISPLNKLYNDHNLLMGFKDNIGIFRTKNTFRILNIASKVENLCVVSTTFHIKPLLKWLQSDRDFLLLGLNKNTISLYRGSMGGIKLVDTMTNNSDWSAGYLNEISRHNKPQLYFAGNKAIVKQLLINSVYKLSDAEKISYRFNRKKIIDLANSIRRKMLDETKKSLDKALLDFYWTDDQKLVRKNIFQVAKAAVTGQIKKLIIADGINVFGKICKTTGSLSINPTSLDHEDDDILDDIAQKVLMSGGEVLVAPIEDIPNQQLALAILAPPKKSVPLIKGTTLNLTDRLAV